MRVALVFPDHVILFPDEDAAKEYLSAMFGHLEEAYTSLDWSIKPVREP